LLRNHNHHAEFRSAVIQHSGLLFTTCRRYAQDRAEAEDWLQDSWLHICQNFDKYDRSRPMVPWLKKITVNVCLQAIRKRKIIYNDIEIDLMDHTPNALDDMKAEELLLIINLMPDLYKTVFNLSVIDGFEHAEIATMLDIKETTSRTRLHRGRLWLQSKLANPIKEVI